jgi:hypothetical protein
MKTILSRINFLRIALLLSLSLSVSVIFAAPDYNFRNPVLVSGTANTVGAVYRFSNVKFLTDALVTITNLANGMVMSDIDGPSGFDEALQPVLQAPASKKGYVEFKITFVITLTSIPAIQLEVPITAIDVDGRKNGNGQAVYEFDQIQTFRGSYVLFDGASNELKISLAPGWATGSNISAIDYAGVDTIAKRVMFGVVNGGISSITVRVGADNQGAASTERLRSFYFKKFAFPNSVLPVANLLSFKGSMASQECKLEWLLGADNNASSVILERSYTTDGFKPVSEFQVNAYGKIATDFGYTDHPEGNIVYYRLKIVSADGQVEYSNILSFKNSVSAAKKLKVYPTLIDVTATATVEADKAQTAFLQWIDLSGKIVQQQSVSLQKGTNSFAVAKQGNLPKGNYIIAVIADNAITTDRVVIR